MSLEGVSLEALRRKSTSDRENSYMQRFCGTNRLGLFEKLHTWPQWGEVPGRKVENCVEGVVDSQIREGICRR